jgi:predicted ATPase/Tfp pilus assembly protein PilF
MTSRVGTPVSLGGLGAGSMVTPSVRLRAPLDSAGRGTVWLADHLGLDTEVLVRFMARGAGDDPSAAARFRRDAAAAARVKSPYVVHVLDYGITDEGAPFVVMERLTGRDLDRLVQDEGPLSSEDGLSLAAQIAHAIDTAHAAGVAHGALRAANVFVSEGVDGGRAVRVLGFGLGLQHADGPLLGGADGLDADAPTEPPLALTARRTALGPHAIAEDIEAMTRLLHGALTGGEYKTPEFKSSPIDLWMLRGTSRGFGTANACVSALEDALAVPDAQLQPTLRPPGPLAGMEDGSVRLIETTDVFVGRTEELSSLDALLAQGARIVTVTGPGGVGKTRFLREFAASARQGIPVRWCDLSDARTVDGVALAVATALDVLLGRDPITQLGYALDGRGPSVLVLDRCEQVTEVLAEVIPKWVTMAPSIRVLLTSRARLGLSEERALSLDPLGETAATELFVARAAARRPGWLPGPEDGPLLAALVRRLDGLPLAVELAASRVDAMSPRAILEQVRDRSTLWTEGDSAAGHAGLRATLDGSWELLRPDERAAFVQLAAFEGGFSLDAAESVLELDALWPLDAVQALVDKCLLRRVGEDRFAMLGMVHSYARERLDESGKSDETEGRHGAYFAAMYTSDRVRSLRTRGGSGRRRAIEQDADNLATACHRAIARGDARTAAFAAAMAWQVFAHRGPFSAGLALLQGALAISDPADRTLTAVRSMRGQALWMTGRTEEARAEFERAVEQSEGLDAEVRVDALRRHAIALQDGAGLREARVPLERALAATRIVGDRMLEGGVLAQLAAALVEGGARDEAESCVHEALACTRAVSDRWNECAALNTLAIIHLERGAPERACASYRDALAIASEEGFVRTEATVLGNLSESLRKLGRLDEARRAAEDSVRCAGELGDVLQRTLSLAELAHVEYEDGRRAEARARFEESEHTLRTLQMRFFLCLILGGRAELEAPFDPAAARAAVTEAEELADALGLAADSGARLRITRARQVLDKPRVEGGDPLPEEGTA